MIMNPDSSRIIDSFSSAACLYDQWSDSQQLIARHLCEWLPLNESIRQILDIGCGTGHLTALLAEHYPDASILGIDFAPGMIETCHQKFGHLVNLDFRTIDALQFESTDMFELVGSNCSFHWMGCPENLLRHLKKYTAPGMFLLASFLTEGSFRELRSCYREITGRTLHGPRLHPAGQIEQALDRAGWRKIKSQFKEHVFNHASCLDLLRTLKESGTTTGPEADSLPLSVAETRNLQEHYTTRYSGADGKVHITWSVLYLLLERVG
jgi:malonyl-CoA O-methyltransferase